MHFDRIAADLGESDFVQSGILAATCSTQKDRRSPATDLSTARSVLWHSVLSSAFTLCSLLLAIFSICALRCASNGSVWQGASLHTRQYIMPLMGMLSTRNRKLATYSVMFVLFGNVLTGINNYAKHKQTIHESYRHGVQSFNFILAQLCLCKHGWHTKPCLQPTQ